MAAPTTDPTLPGVARGRVRATRATKPPEPVAEVDPVARVLVDVALAHLDRTFDYTVPASLAEDAQPGVRVKVRFAGRDVSGFVVARAAASEHGGRLTPLRRVVSAEPVLTVAVAALAGDLADRYAGTRSDVLRLAVPPRHAGTEQKPSAPPPDPDPYDPAAAAQAWAEHPPGPAFVSHLAAGGSPRAVWGAAPGTDWPQLVAAAVAATLASGRGALICVPDRHDVSRVAAALETALGRGVAVVLTADAGPARRYREFLAVSRGLARVVVGTRAAAYAPVRDLGLVVIWDDGDDLHAEPRAPYPHTRETLLIRAEREQAAALLGGFGTSVEADQLVRRGWAHRLSAPRTSLRDRVTVSVAGADDVALERDPLARASRLPSAAYRALRDGLRTGPVLVQTPRAGYAVALACERCRTPARCAVCHGPLALGSATAAPTCRWCGTAAPGWACAECGHRGLRAPVVGQERTAEELGRSFSGVLIRVSAAEQVLEEVGAEPAVVVATPGAEPVAAGGYAAVVLLDTWLLLGLVHLRAEEEALRRWCNAVGLVRPGGSAVVVGDPAHPAIQALVRWDPSGFADREAGLRREAHLPPASRLATVTGAPDAVDDVLALLPRPPGLELLGPVPLPFPRSATGAPAPECRAVVRAPRAHGSQLSSALAEVQRLRSARKLDAVRIQVDPPTL